MLTKPEVIREIHSQYVAAGADIIETNTFSDTRIAMADYGLEDYVPELNRAAAASPARPPMPARIAASLSPGPSGRSNRTLSISRDVNDPASAR